MLGAGRGPGLQKGSLAGFPSLELEKQETSRDPRCRGGGGREAPTVPQVDVAVSLKAILKQTFLSPAVLSAKGFQPSA